MFFNKVLNAPINYIAKNDESNTFEDGFWPITQADKKFEKKLLLKF
jgi:hypothetical protein